MEASTSSTHTTPPQKTILSVVQDFSFHDAFTSQSTHPFAADPESSVKMLRDLIDATVQISGSLNSHVTLPLSNPKLLSLFRQQTAISHTVHNADHTVRKTVEILRKRAGIVYGEDIPLDRSLIADWAVSRLESWAVSAGMESFKDEERDGHLTMTLAGKVIVVDIDLPVDRRDPQNPSISVTSVKTSYAVPNAASGPTSSNTEGSISLDGYLSDSLREFFTEVQKQEEDQDPEHAANIGTRIADSFKYLMMSDQLALAEGDNGLRWFNDIDTLSLEVERFAAAEALSISRELNAGPCSLDIFLMRAHGLPLPYLTVPSLSFVVYASPLAYLNMLRKSSGASSALTNPFLPQLDIPFSVIRSYVGSHPRPPGIIIANVVLSQADSVLFSGHSSPVGMEALATRPTFPLASEGEEKELYFPTVPPSITQPKVASGFFLDFTDGGKYPGVVISQSRMREIEMVLNPLGVMDLPNVPMVAFGAGSWVDMLLGGQHPIPSERYTATYTSPTSAHPPLQLRLTAPEEPGFRLEKVPVRNLKSVWGILEIVKEQCWLNEILLSCQWVSESAATDQDINGTSAATATEEDLEAVLGGTVAPRRIPVNVYVPTTSIPMFDAMSISVGQRATKIVLTSPERPPISGLVEITASYDCTRPCGVVVSVNGAIGADIKTEVLEEVCRRGGILGLPGRLWAKGHGIIV